MRQGKRWALFQPAPNRVQLPSLGAFLDPIGYYATLSSEAIHWAGPKGQLDRDMTRRFGSEGYAAEELVARLGAAFLCADLNLVNEPRPDPAAGVASGLEGFVLRQT